MFNNVDITLQYIIISHY